MPNNSIKLYTYVTSPFAMKVHSYLIYKQLNFKVLYVNPLKVKQILPIGKTIPVLSINGQSINDSHKVPEWLDDLFPESLRLLPTNTNIKKRTLREDNWLNTFLIPSLFYSIYPSLNAQLFTNIKSNWRLGQCVAQTTQGSIPWPIPLAWPLFIHNATFIKRIIAPFKHQNPTTLRLSCLAYIEKSLDQHLFLADNYPTLADISAWGLLISPYQLGLNNMNDIFSYPNINRWLKQLAPLLLSNKAPKLVPDILNPISLPF